MTTSEKYQIALKFQNEGDEVVYQAIMSGFNDDQLLELLGV